MAHINRRYIDKHWLVFMLRGGLAIVFGFLALFGALADLESVIATISVFLLGMGIIDSVSALYNSTKNTAGRIPSLTRSSTLLQH